MLEIMSALGTLEDARRVQIEWAASAGAPARVRLARRPVPRRAARLRAAAALEADVLGRRRVRSDRRPEPRRRGDQRARRRADAAGSGGSTGRRSEMSSTAPVAGALTTTCPSLTEIACIVDGTLIFRRIAAGGGVQVQDLTAHQHAQDPAIGRRSRSGRASSAATFRDVSVPARETIWDSWVPPAGVVVSAQTAPGTAARLRIGSLTPTAARCTGARPTVAPRSRAWARAR